MNVHGNAKLGRAGRRALVGAVERGASLREAASGFGVSPATAHLWWTRWQQASEPQRRSLACLADRSSRPHRSPGRLSDAAQARICAARRRTGWGPRLLAGLVGHPHQTVWKVLHRHGVSRAPRAGRDPACRYEWPCPGDLLHMDTKRYARFDQPGHKKTGDRRVGSPGAGYEYAHSIVDDHSRLAYTELHRDERGATVVGFVERAIAFFRGHGIEPRRLQTDNAWTYVKNRALADLLAREDITHRTIPPRTPKRNGKVERYQQTLKREWGLGQRYRSSAHRAEALPHWLHHYNHTRRHSSIGDRPPINRVRDVLRQDT